MIYIGIDNGVSGSIAGINSPGDLLFWRQIPTKNELSYTTVKRFISRVDTPALQKLLLGYMAAYGDVQAIIERPMVNPTRFNASLSAVRALEATLIVLEYLVIPYHYIDSKTWQRDMFPKKMKGKDLKKAALSVAQRLFPVALQSQPHPDVDGLLIAYWFYLNHSKIRRV